MAVHHILRAISSGAPSFRVRDCYWLRCNCRSLCVLGYWILDTGAYKLNKLRSCGCVRVVWDLGIRVDIHLHQPPVDSRQSLGAVGTSRRSHQPANSVYHTRGALVGFGGGVGGEGQGSVRRNTYHVRVRVRVWALVWVWDGGSEGVRVALRIFALASTDF